MDMGRSVTFVRWVRSLDIRTVIIGALLVSDAGHVGRLFSVREASDRTFIGYVLAFCLDAGAGLALYDMVNVRKRSRRVFAFFVFVFAAAVAGGFSLAYYRDTCASDPLWVSALMAGVAPILAGLLSVMRAFGVVERTEAEQSEREAERSLQLRKYKIEQSEQTKRTLAIEQERTKQVRANARAERANAEASVQSAKATKRGNGRARAGGFDAAARTVLLQQPDIGPRPLSRELGCSPSTASGILKRLNDNGREG